MNAPTLIYHHRPTVALNKLQEGLSSDGATITRRKRGWTDYNIIKSLVACGWLEEKPAGPRGGARYFTTPAGVEAMQARQP